MMLIASALLAALLFSYVTRPPPRPELEMGPDRRRTQAALPTALLPGELSSREVAQCRQRIANAVRDGVIRERPAPERIGVDERLWEELTQVARSRLMRAIACDAWKAAAPPAEARVIAYGWSSGRRLSMLGGIRGAR